MDKLSEKRGTCLAPVKFSSEQVSDLNFRPCRTCNDHSQASVPERDGDRDTSFFGLLH